MRKLNLNKLNNKKHINISSKDALKDVVPFKWSYWKVKRK